MDELPEMAKYPAFQREFHYTNEIGNNDVYMLLGLPIGQPSSKQPRTIIGAVFAEEMYFWRSQGKNICVKINCPGGNILDGFSIIDAIRQTGAKTQNIGIAASMGLNILLSGSHRSGYEYSKGMIHGPQGSDKSMVDMMRDSLSNLLQKLSNFTKHQVEDMLKEDAPDTWLTAKEMKTKGLIDEVIPTEVELQGEEKDPYALYAVYNQLIEKEMAKENEGDALKIIADVQAKLEANTTAMTAKDTEIADLKAKLKAKEDAEKLAVQAAGKAIVEAAIKDKKLSDKAELKDQFVKMAVDSPEAFKAMLDSKVAQRSSVVAHMKAEGAEVVEEETYEFLANNDTKKLYDMMDNDPEKYTKLVAKWQEKERNKKIA